MGGRWEGREGGRHREEKQHKGREVRKHKMNYMYMCTQYLTCTCTCYVNSVHYTCSLYMINLVHVYAY